MKARLLISALLLMLLTFGLGWYLGQHQESRHTYYWQQEAVKSRQNLLESYETLYNDILMAEKAKSDLLAVLGTMTASNYELSSESVKLRAEVNSLKKQLADARRYGGLREFGSVDELMQWLYENPVSTRPRVPGEYVCSDYALDLVLDAISQGKLMGLQRLAKEPFQGGHQKAFTIIGKDIYEIEAENDGIKFVGRVY